MVAWLDSRDPTEPFPPADRAEAHLNGLLAMGGDLSLPRLLNAYRNGIFPWFNPGEPILWWSPDPRVILIPKRVHLSRSLRKCLRKQPFRITLDHDFSGVIQSCAAPRPRSSGTWLVQEMIEAYIRLHRAGWAHSVEVWQGETLVGGLYGVALGRMFFGESMFSRVSNASKVALVALCQVLDAWGYGLIDCQVVNPHLLRMGAEQISRQRFLRALRILRAQPAPRQHWKREVAVSTTWLPS